jgi:protein-disulfide isomerase
MAAETGMKKFYLMLILAAVVGVVVLGFLVLRPRTVSIPVPAALLPSDTAGFRGYLLGADGAPVEITEYADYQCPACQDFETVQFPDIRTRLIAAGQVRWRYRDFPLDQHKFGRLSAHAAACADAQGKFWDMHERIYAGQYDWSRRGDASGDFRHMAEASGLNLVAYDACMSSGRYAGRIQASLLEGERLGVNSTPTFLIGGRLYSGRVTVDGLKAMVDSVKGRAAR